MNEAMKYQQGDLKLSVLIDPLVSDEYLSFLAQLGVRYAYSWVNDDQLTVEFIDGLRRRALAHGITLYNVGNLTLGKSASIHLALADRDQMIERFIGFLKMLSLSGIHTTTITWEPNGTLSTSPLTSLPTYEPDAVTRGGARARMIDLNVLNKMPPSHGRVYTKEETWANFTYFVNKVVPAAERYGVRISLHPNDPPTSSVAGIATLIQSAEDYRRAFEIANSDFFGMEFCCGCWLEGGRGAFGDIQKNFREFAARDKVFIVHFRNVTGTLPCFVETFLNDGYGDMPAIMKTIVETGYSGTLTLDHSPRMQLPCADPIAAECAQTAYAIGYLQALRQSFGG